MNTDAIFDKYAAALDAIGSAVRPPSTDAVLLALRLAVQDAYAAGGALGDDLAAIVASQSGAEQQLAQLDADNAELLQRLRLLEGTQAENVRLRQEIADLREQVIPDYQARLNALTVAPHTNGTAHASTSVDPTPAAQSPDWGRNHPAWQALPAADLAVIDQLSSYQIKFRSLSKTLRRDLVLRAIRHLAGEHGGTLSSSAWDRNRPLWLPTQGAVMMLSADGRWPSLLAMALEPMPA